MKAYDIPRAALNGKTIVANECSHAAAVRFAFFCFFHMYAVVYLCVKQSSST